MLYVITDQMFQICNIFTTVYTITYYRGPAEGWHLS